MSDIEQGMNQFINEQRIQFPSLTNFDVANLKVGFANGVEWEIKRQMRQEREA